MNITVFGGSQPKPHEPVYIEAQRFGYLLGAQRHTVLTGGYIGTMEAVSRGAASAGAHVIGVTCDQIEAWRLVHPNAWVAEERRCSTLQQRIMTLIEACDLACALPGGPGTLTEISLMWNLLLTSSISPRRLILIGKGWDVTFKSMFKHLSAYIPEDQRKWLSFVPDVDAAARLISELQS